MQFEVKIKPLDEIRARHDSVQQKWGVAYHFKDGAFVHGEKDGDGMEGLCGHRVIWDSDKPDLFVGGHYYKFFPSLFSEMRALTTHRKLMKARRRVGFGRKTIAKR